MVITNFDTTEATGSQITEPLAYDGLPATKEDLLALQPVRPADAIDRIEDIIIENIGEPSFQSCIKPVTTSQAREAGEGSLPACDWRLVSEIVKIAERDRITQITALNWQEVKNATTFALRRRGILRRQRLEKAQQMVSEATFSPRD